VSGDHADGVLAIWHDIRAGREDAFEAWYRDEHFPERLAVPGFRIGRRYEAASGAPRYFCCYVTDTPKVLISAPYLARLNDPTPLTRAMMTDTFINMHRTVCRRVERRGALAGAVAVTARFDAAPAEASVRAMLDQLDGADGVARCEYWVAAEDGQGVAAEEALRGRDRKIAACLIAETLRLADAERLAAALAATYGEAAVGIYRLLCALRAGAAVS
jgi:hypothetical protein